MVGLEHLVYFSLLGLKLLLARMGFLIIRAQSRGFDPISFWKDIRGRQLTGQFSRVEFISQSCKTAALRRNATIRCVERELDYVLNWAGIGSMLIISARKA